MSRARGGPNLALPNRACLRSSHDGNAKLGGHAKRSPTVKGLCSVGYILTFSSHPARLGRAKLKIPDTERVMHDDAIGTLAHTRMQEKPSEQSITSSCSHVAVYRHSQQGRRAEGAGSKRQRSPSSYLAVHDLCSFGARPPN